MVEAVQKRDHGRIVHPLGGASSSAGSSCVAFVATQSTSTSSSSPARRER